MTDKEYAENVGSLIEDWEDERMSYEEHIEGLKGIKPFLQKKMLEINYEGLGELDAKEIGETIDAAIDAIEKQIPKKPKLINKNVIFDGNWDKVCPCCNRILIRRITTETSSEPIIFNYTLHCDCGQHIDWSEE